MTTSKTYLEIPTPSGHASTLAALGERLYLAYFGGSREGADDVGIYMSRLERGAWAAPVLVAKGEREACWNPVLLASEGGLTLYYKLGRAIGTWRAMRMTLDEGLRVIEPPRPLCPGEIGGRGPVRNRCLRLPGGELLAPGSTETQGWRPCIDVSFDGGRTFPKRIAIPMPREGEGAIQPALWQSADGSVHALMRSTAGVLLRSDSRDGERFSAAYRTEIPNNNSGIDCERLDGGRVALALNPVSGNWAARTPLWLYLSEDDGERFEPWLALENEQGEYSYPCLLRHGGKLYVSYTHRRERFAVWTLEAEAFA